MRLYSCPRPPCSQKDVGVRVALEVWVRRPHVSILGRHPRVASSSLQLSLSLSLVNTLRHMPPRFTYTRVVVLSLAVSSMLEQSRLRVRHLERDVSDMFSNNIPACTRAGLLNLLWRYTSTTRMPCTPRWQEIHRWRHFLGDLFATTEGRHFRQRETRQVAECYRNGAEHDSFVLCKSTQVGFW